MIKSGIYKITSLIGKVYIGRSINIKRRFSDYRRLSCKNQPLLYNSFLKYGFDNHKFEIICYCHINLLDDKESYFINFYSSNNRGLGLNCTSGGKTCVFTEETKLKMSIKAKGRVSCRKGARMSDEARAKMSAAKKGKTPWNKGVKLSAEHIEKVASKKRGTKLSEETKLKMSISRRGKTNLKKVLDEKTGEIFNSVGLAAIYANLKYNTLIEMLKGRNRNKTNLKYYKP